MGAQRFLRVPKIGDPVGSSGNSGQTIGFEGIRRLLDTNGCLELRATSSPPRFGGGGWFVATAAASLGRPVAGLFLTEDRASGTDDDDDVRDGRRETSPGGTLGRS